MVTFGQTERLLKVLLLEIHAFRVGPLLGIRKNAGFTVHTLTAINNKSNMSYRSLELIPLLLPL